LGQGKTRRHAAGDVEHGPKEKQNKARMKQGFDRSSQKTLIHRDRSRARYRRQAAGKRGLLASAAGRAAGKHGRAADKRGRGRQERQGGRHPLLTRASAAWQRILRAVNVEYVKVIGSPGFS